MANRKDRATLNQALDHVRTEYRGSQIEPFDQVRMKQPIAGYVLVGTVRHRHEDGVHLDVALRHADAQIDTIFKVCLEDVVRVAVLRRSTHKGTMAEAVEVFKKANAAGRRLAKVEKPHVPYTGFRRCDSPDCNCGGAHKKRERDSATYGD